MSSHTMWLQPSSTRGLAAIQLHIKCGVLPFVLPEPLWLQGRVVCMGEGNASPPNLKQAMKSWTRPPRHPTFLPLLLFSVGYFGSSTSQRCRFVACLLFQFLALSCGLLTRQPQTIQHLRPSLTACACWYAFMLADYACPCCPARGELTPLASPLERGRYFVTLAAELQPARTHLPLCCLQAAARVAGRRMAVRPLASVTAGVETDVSKRTVPLEMEKGEMPLNTFSNKAPFKGKVKSVERIVGPKATGETCHIIIETEGKIPFWEGQSYGVIPPVSS